MNKITLLFRVFMIIVLYGCKPYADSPVSSNYNDKERPLDVKMGTRFTPIPDKAMQAPVVNKITIPLPDYASNADAIWGATGRDDDGMIYFAVSTSGISQPLGNDSRTAYLYQYDPNTNNTLAQSDVITELKRTGLYQGGMGQNKIHSKVLQANDGYLYFASLDEEGEDDNINPKWGGHLWRKKPKDIHWEHVLSTPEALIAVNTDGRYVYALGYWDHVLYQFDTNSKVSKSITVGSVEGHISRNFLVDHAGHVYVPQLKNTSFDGTVATLNEYDTSLALIATYPMPNYQHDNIKYHHGIIGYTSMRNGNILFTTSDGSLFRINTGATQNKLESMGTLHPEIGRYSPSLFTYSGNGYLLGYSQGAEDALNWSIFHTSLKDSINFYLNSIDVGKAQFWGTTTKDDTGSFYIAGWTTHDRKPIIVKLSTE